MHCLALGSVSGHEMISPRLVLRTQPQSSIMPMLLFLWYFAPHFEWDNFLSRLLRVATLIFVLCIYKFEVLEELVNNLTR